MGKTTEKPKIVVVLLLFLLGSLFFCTSASASELTKPKNVLILFSAAPGQPVFDMTLSEFRKTLREGHGGPLNFFVEYLEMERFPDKSQIREQINLIKKMYTREKMDLLISIGPDIIPLISQYLSPDFDTVPTIFVRFRSKYSGDPLIDRKPNMTGLIVEVDPKKTFETALSLHPATTEAFIITGSAPSDRVLESVARVALHEYEDRVRVTYLSGLAMEELLQRMRILPKNSIVIYLAFQKDATGVNYYAMESLKLLSEASSVPLYSNWEQFVGYGIVGGYVIGVKANASRIGQIALRILQGEDPNKIPIERGFMLYMFDWRQMKRWGIQERRLPEGSIIINKELTFWEAFRWYIIGTVVFVTIETLLVVFLVALYRKQKRVEKQLYEAAEEWRTTFDSIQDLIFILGLDFKIIRANAPALAFLNLPVEKVLGRHCYSLMHETNEPPETCLVPSMTKTKRHEHTEFYDQKRKAWLHLSVAPILDDKGKIQSIVHQIRDITGQKQTEEEIHLARAELLRVERSFRISELTASLAHELNQPLAAILSNAQAALHFLESDKPDLKEFREILRDIIQDDKRAGNVIRSLRAMMKREEGEKKPIILNDVLKDVIAIFHSEAVFRNIKIKTDLAESLPPILADRIQLQQVTLNLVMNAAEAMAQNPSEERKIILRTHAADTCVRVSVRDFGRGIDNEDLKRVFEPFFTKKGAGLGMGLPISKSIIEAHGGRIWGENHPDGGATFAFELPVMDNK